MIKWYFLHLFLIAILLMARFFYSTLQLPMWALYGQDIILVTLVVALFYREEKKPKLEFPGIGILLALIGLFFLEKFFNMYLVKPLLANLDLNVAQSTSATLKHSFKDIPIGTPSQVDVHILWVRRVLYAPITEEIIMRALMIGVFLRKGLNPVYLGIMSIMTFIYLHSSFAYFWQMPMLEHAFLISSYFSTALILVLVYFKFGIIAAIFLHIVQNLVVFLSVHDHYSVISVMMMVGLISIAYQLITKIVQRNKLA